MGRLVCWIVLAIAVCFAVAARAAPTADERVRAETTRVYDRSNYQRDLPGEREPPPPRVRHDVDFSLDGGSLVSFLLIGLVVVVVVVVALRLLSGEWTLLPRAPEAPPDEATPAELQTGQLRVQLDAADRRAVAGDWADAIHILLLTSIDLLRRRVGQEVPDAMTARELIGEAKLPSETRADFAALVVAAELCHFGGRVANRALYDRCRAHYERLWGMAPEAVA